MDDMTDQDFADGPEPSSTDIVAMPRSFGDLEHQQRRGSETHGQALAAAAKAQIQALCWMALERPRDMQLARRMILAECERPAFAEKATYSIKRGRKKEGNKWVDNYVEGPSIHLARAVRRAMRNLMTSTTPTYEDDAIRIVEIVTTDFESNITLRGSITVAKTVERKQVYESTIVLSKRQNSDGADVYIVAATDAEAMEKQNSLAARVERNQILALLPADLRDEAVAKAKATALSTATRELDGKRKKWADFFAKHGVPDAEVELVLGKPLADARADDIIALQGLQSAIGEKATTWAAEVDRARQEQAAAASAEPAPEATPGVKTRPTAVDGAAAAAAIKNAANKDKP